MLLFLMIGEVLLKKNGLPFPTCFCYESVMVQYIYATGTAIEPFRVLIIIFRKRHTKAKISE